MRRSAILGTLLVTMGACDAQTPPQKPTAMIPAAVAGATLSQSAWATWTKRNNPVFTGQYSVSSDPSVVRDASGYRMYYTGLDPGPTRTILCAATSADGINWKEIDTDSRLKGLVLGGQSGNWDENLESGFALPYKGKTFLYYSGYRDEGVPAKGFPASLGLATSTDGKAFSRMSDKPILPNTPGMRDCDAIYSAVILPEGEKLNMIYVGHAYSNKEGAAPNGVFLLGATSADGVHWDKRAEPVLESSKALAWTKDGVAEPALVKGPDQAYYLFFTGLKDEERVIGVARGPAPFGPWEINPQPIITPTAGDFDEHQVLAPVVLIENDSVRMWYLGADTKEHLAVGYAECAWPIHAVAASGKPAKK